MNYTIGTFLFNYFELGIFLYGLLAFGLKEAVCIAVFFKIGKLISEIIRCSNIKIIATTLLISSGLLIIFKENLLLVCSTSAFIEVSIIWARMFFKQNEQPSKKNKVFARMLGFICAPLFTTLIFLPISLYWLLSTNLQKGDVYYRRIFPTINKDNVFYYLVLFFHHMHYFMYCYMIPYILIVSLGINYLWTGILFFVGWGAYNMYEGRIKPSPTYIATGHIISAVGLIIIWIFQSNFYIVMFGWFLTGLGGGTFYMIKSNLQQENDGELVELYAQLMGTVLFYSAVVHFSFDFIFTSAILFAMVVTAISLGINNKEESHGGNNCKDYNNNK